MPPKTKNGRPKDFVWQHFEEVGPDKRSRCKKCLAIVSGKPLRLKRHFESCNVSERHGSNGILHVDTQANAQSKNQQQDQAHVIVLGQEQDVVCLQLVQDEPYLPANGCQEKCSSQNLAVSASNSSGPDARPISSGSMPYLALSSTDTSWPEARASSSALLPCLSATDLSGSDARSSSSGSMLCLPATDSSGPVARGPDSALAYSVVSSAASSALKFPSKTSPGSKEAKQTLKRSRPPPNYTPISNYVHSTTDKELKKIQEKWAEFFFANRLPFVVSEHPTFVAALEATRPGITSMQKVLSRKLLSGTLLDEAEKTIENRLKGELYKKKVILAQDGWSNVHK